MSAILDDPQVHGLHPGARFAYRVLAFVTLLTVIFSPLALWPLFLSFRARIVRDRKGLTRVGLFSHHLLYADLTHLALLHNPIQASGLAGIILRSQSAGKGESLHLVMREGAGQELSIHLSTYERSEELLAAVRDATGLDCPDIQITNYRSWKHGLSPPDSSTGDSR